MVINIARHYFWYYANHGEIKKLGKFQVGEIITDWEGCTGVILMLFKNGDVRTDSSGMGSISEIKKVRSKEKIRNYLHSLHEADLYSLQRDFEKALGEI